MRDLGYDLRRHFPKGLSYLPDVEFHVAVTVGCQDQSPALRAKHGGDWIMPVAKWIPPEKWGEVRDQIGEKVKGLLAWLGHAT